MLQLEIMTILNYLLLLLCNFTNKIMKEFNNPDKIVTELFACSYIHSVFIHILLYIL